MFLKLGHKDSEWNCNAEIGKHVCGPQVFIINIFWKLSDESAALRLYGA